MLTIRLIHRRNRSRNRLVLCGDGDRVANIDLQPVRTFARQRHQRMLRTIGSLLRRPPRPAHHRISRWRTARRRRPRHIQRLRAAPSRPSPRLLPPLLQTLAVNLRQPRTHHRNHLRRSLHHRLLRQQRPHAAHFVRPHIHQKNIRQIARSRHLHLIHNRVLHKIHRRNLHHAQPQRGQQRCAWISRPIQIRQPMPQRRRQTQPCPPQKLSQQPKRQRRHPQQHQQRSRQPQRKRPSHLCESDTREASPTSPSKIKTLAPICATDPRSFFISRAANGSSSLSTFLRKIKIGLTPRISSSGGSVNSSVVNNPAPSPNAIACGCSCNLGVKCSSFARKNGNESCTPTPSTTPSNPPPNPSSSVCNK